MSQTVIYEINALAEAGLVEAFEKYMRERHIPDLMKTGYFHAAYLTRTLENRYRIQYHARDENVLREYLNKEAERLRADFIAHFPEGIELSREVWEVVESWPAD
jgi:Domain of unknown function (DUF4286)